MKKSFKVFMMLSVVAIFLASCNKKTETLLTPSYTYHIKANETYTFTLPTNTDDEFVITTNPTHALVNVLGLDSAGNKIYTYTPILDYTGTDHVVLSTVEETHTGKKPHGPNRPKGTCHAEENDYIITIDFVIDPNVK